MKKDYGKESTKKDHGKGEKSGKKKAEGSGEHVSQARKRRGDRRK